MQQAKAIYISDVPAKNKAQKVWSSLTVPLFKLKGPILSLTHHKSETAHLLECLSYDVPEDYDPLVQMDRGRKYSSFCEQVTPLLPFEHK